MVTNNSPYIFIINCKESVETSHEYLLDLAFTTVIAISKTKFMTEIIFTTIKETYEDQLNHQLCLIVEYPVDSKQKRKKQIWLTVKKKKILSE